MTAPVGSTTRAPRTAATRTLVGLSAFLGLGAIGGGVTFLLDPSGGAAGLTVELLERAPVDSYLLPGLLLVLGFGVPASILVAAILRPGDGPPRLRVLRWVEQRSRHRWAWLGSRLLGAVLMVWIVVQVLLIEFSWFQPLMLLIGAALVALPASRGVRSDLRRGPRR